jgi:hypothetical protein
MIYLVVDTNNWIYLANSKNPDTGKFEDERHMHLLGLLIDRVNKGDVEVLLCDIVEKEWERNKSAQESLIAKYQNENEAYKSIIKKMRLLLDEEDAKDLSNIYEKYVAKTQAIIEVNKKHIKEVWTLMKKAKKYSVSNETKAVAADWAVEKKAPFIGDKKNSMADALIFFGAAEYLKNIAKTKDPWEEDDHYEFPISVFVSGNKGDFSNPLNLDELHNDLKPIADEVKMNFFRSLPLALNYLEETIKNRPALFNLEELETIEEAIEEFSDDWYVCDICSPDGDNQYTNIVHFSEPFEIDFESKDELDKNQLRIDYGDEPQIVQKPLPYLKIKTGECSWCSTTHLQCCKCNTVTALETNGELEFQCEGCGQIYIFKKIYEGSGMFTEEILASNRQSMSKSDLADFEI